VTVHTVRGTETHHIQLAEDEWFKYQTPYRKAPYIARAVTATVVDGVLRSVLVYSRGEDSSYTDTVQRPYPVEVVALLERHGIKP
jgi:hypothetical protein